MADSPTKTVEDGPKAPAAQDITHDAPVAAIDEGALDPVYAAKARVLNKAIQDIGMGRYQWQV